MPQAVPGTGLVTDEMKTHYSGAPIMFSDGSGPKGMAVPFIADGRIVHDRDRDNA
jgi:hypothetical protein